MIDPLGVERGRAPLDAVDDVALGEQERREIGAVLPGHAGEQRNLWYHLEPRSARPPARRAAVFRAGATAAETRSLTSLATRAAARDGTKMRRLHASGKLGAAADGAKADRLVLLRPADEAVAQGAGWTLGAARLGAGAGPCGSGRGVALPS
jgi:hypothetical protein